MKSRLPWLVVRLLERALPGDAVEPVAGDLEEELSRKHRSRLWLWRQVLGIVLGYAREHRARGGRGGWNPRAGMDAVLADLRLARRAAMSSPSFAAVVVALVGLGIGANGAMFHWVDSVLFAPLPYPDASRLVRVTAHGRERPVDVSPPDYFDLAESAEIFDGIAAYWSPEITLTGAGEPERLLGATATHTLFDVLGVRPALGRSFTSSDDVPGAPLVAVLSDGLFRRRFGGDPDVLGRTLVLDGLPAEIVGVAPSGLDFPREGTELWIPLRLPRERPPRAGTPYRSFRILEVVGRLEHGVPIARARAAIEALGRRLEADHPDSNRDVRYGLAGLRDATTAAFRPALLLLWGTVALVFAVVCLNVGGLFLGRAAARERELAVRVALGATRWRVYRQLVAESLLLVVAGGALGLVLARGSTRLLSAFEAEGLPAPGDFAAGGRLLAFVVALVLLASLVFGAAPALLSGRKRLAGRLSARTGGGQRRAGRWLVVVEVALALVLLAGAGLFLRSFVQLRSIDPGFRESDVAYGRIELPFRDYAENHRRATFFERVRRGMAESPGVEGASLSLGVPLDPRSEFFVTRSPFSVEGRPEAEPGRKPEAALHVVGPDFFRVLGVSIEAGRDFHGGDDASSASVAIVNRALAEQFWPGEDPLGRTLTHDLVLLPEDAPNTRRVVGVVSDFSYYRLAGAPEPQIYVPHAQTPWPQMHLVVRGSADPDALTARLREILRVEDPSVPAAGLVPLAQVRRAVAGPRLRALVLTGFAAAALLLAAVGIYGLMALSVASRVREIGIRVALGARRNEVLVLFVADGLKLAVLGACLGVPLALLAARWTSGLLYGVSPLDPWTYGFIVSVLLSSALLASLLPARRATGVDPVEALRSDSI